MKGEYFSMSETKSTYDKGTLYKIKVMDLQTDPNQPRKYFDPEAQKDLVNSFQNQGVLQPVLFREDQGGNLFIVAGERRLQAAKEAELETIPAILVEGNYDEIALVENLLRQDLTAIEVAEALDRIMKEHNYTQEQLTGIIGKAKSTVSEILSLNRLPEKIRDECRNDPTTSRKTLIAIAKKKQQKGMLTAYKKFKERRVPKERVKGSKGKRKSWQDKFTSKYEILTTFVADMDLGTMDTPERKDLISRINELKKTADSLIAKIKATPVKKVKPAEKPKKVKKDKKKSVSKPATKKVKKPSVSKTKK
jgi:ParB family transcriptional regulator, chromosome partitioning protein